MRALLLAAALLLPLAGCTSPGSAEEEPVVNAQGGRVTFEGLFDITRVDGTEVSRNGGEHALAVPDGGWRNVNVQLDIAIEALLVLLPPGCAASSEDCAFTQPFPASTAEEKRWLVPAMQPGTWTVRLESSEENDQLYRSGRYTITLDYIEDQPAA